MKFLFGQAQGWEIGLGSWDERPVYGWGWYAGDGAGDEL